MFAGFLGEVFLLYGEAGVAFYHDNDIDDSKFSYALGAGYKAPFGNKAQFLQLSAFYNAASGDNNSDHWINFRVAYGFGFGAKNSSEK